MEAIRKFVNTGAGRITAGLLLAFAMAFMFWTLSDAFGEPSFARASRDRLFIDTTTGQPFEAEMQTGWRIPIPAPSGENTGVPAEMCSWNKDGTVRKSPVPVLLNEYVKKPGPTFCPDCGRLVVLRNPTFEYGATDLPSPPPTEAEWKSKPTHAKANQD